MDFRPDFKHQRGDKTAEELAGNAGRRSPRLPSALEEAPGDQMQVAILGQTLTQVTFPGNWDS